MLLIIIIIITNYNLITQGWTAALAVLKEIVSLISSTPPATTPVGSSFSLPSMFDWSIMPHYFLDTVHNYYNILHVRVCFLSG